MAWSKKLAYIPATTSSRTTANPPRIWCSINLAGLGLIISKTRKKRNPPITVVIVRGKKAMVTKYPTTSSMTILGQSFCSQITSACSDAHQAKKKAAAELNR